MKTLTITVLALLASSVPAESANERMYMGFSADSILGACISPDRSQLSLGFCIGFIYAIAYDASTKGKSCAFGPVNFDPVVQEAVNALEKQKQQHKGASHAHPRHWRARVHRGAPHPQYLSDRLNNDRVTLALAG